VSASYDERERLLQACKESREPLLYLVVIVALATGMRSSEIRGLTWDRVDLRTGRIVLEDTKNGERRTVPLVGRALEVLKEHGKVRRLDTPLLFPRPRDPQRPIRLDHAWAQAVEAAGIQNFRFHDLRHSAASYMLMNGATLGELAEVLGHKTLAMVKRYSHLSEPHTRGLLERMNAAVFGGQ